MKSWNSGLIRACIPPQDKTEQIVDTGQTGYYCWLLLACNQPTFQTFADCYHVATNTQVSQLILWVILGSSHWFDHITTPEYVMYEAKCQKDLWFHTYSGAANRQYPLKLKFLLQKGSPVCRRLKVIRQTSSTYMEFATPPSTHPLPTYSFTTNWQPPYGDTNIRLRMSTIAVFLVPQRPIQLKLQLHWSWSWQQAGYKTRWNMSCSTSVKCQEVDVTVMYRAEVLRRVGHHVTVKLPWVCDLIVGGVCE